MESSQVPSPFELNVWRNDKVFETNELEPDHKPIVRLRPGIYPELCAELETILRESSIGIYKYGTTLVTVVWDEVRIGGGQTEVSPRNHLVTAPNLLNIFAQAAIFQKYSKPDDEWVRCNPPPDLAAQFLAKGEWNLPDLVSVITAPTIRANGTLLDTPGYDQESKIIYDPRGVIFPTILDSPTREDALAAVQVLLKPLRYFTFVTDADRSVALSAVLTTCIRQAVENAPLHAFDAPIKGSGKSNLVDYASVIATGHRAAVTTVGKSNYGSGDAELEKRIGASLLAGDAVISLDNVERELSGEILCQMLTQSTVKIRILGTSQQPTVPSIASVFATGNNIQIAGDLTRRSLISRINPQAERPELKEYPFNPVKLAKRARPILLTAALTIIRAYLSQKRRIKITPLGSYEEWSHYIREPLIWLGEADPVDAMERIRSSDPILTRLSEFCTAWANVIGINEEVFTRDIIAACYKRNITSEGNEVLVNPELYESTKVVATGKSDKISPDRLGCYLRANQEREISINLDPDNEDNRTIVRIYKSKESTIGARWKLEQLSGLPQQRRAPLHEFDYDTPPF